MLFFLLLLNCGSWFGLESPRNSSASYPPQRPCNWNIIKGVRETPKNGTANIICLITKFDQRQPRCWSELAEYYNVVPVPGVRTQRIYFVAVPERTPAIRTLAALRSSAFRSQTFFEYAYDTTGKSRFVTYPFRHKKAH